MAYGHSLTLFCLRQITSAASDTQRRLFSDNDARRQQWGLVMIADMHVHSTFSPDGISTMEEQCIAALEKGERIICFTDHVDYNVAEKNNGIIKDNSKANFIIEEYLIEIDRLRKKYPELKILKGIEFSEPHLFKKEFERY